MGYLPPIIQAEATESSFNSIFSEYGSIHGSCTFSYESLQAEIDTIIMSSDRVYCSAISNNSSYVNDVVLNGGTSDYKIIRAILLANNPFTITDIIKSQFAGVTTYSVNSDSSGIITINNVQYYGMLYYISSRNFSGSDVISSSFTVSGVYTILNTCEEAVIQSGVYGIRQPITYRLTNCTAPSAPTEAVIGDTVTVSLQFSSGYGIVNPSSDVYVTNNGVVVPSQYSNGVLTFTMPNPSQ